jgi:hypothetical protein
MKVIDLAHEQHTLAELLELAQSDDILIHSTTGEDYVLELADEFEREVAALGASDKFISYLKARADESDDLTLKQVRDRQVGDE